MAKVMISGPFSALMTPVSTGGYSFADDFRARITKILSALRNAGHEVLSAHIADSYGEQPWVSNFVSRDLDWTSSCDVQVVLLPKSENGDAIRSDGTMIELGFALAHKRPIVLLHDELDHPKNSFFLRSFIQLEGVHDVEWTDGHEDKLLEVIEHSIGSIESSSSKRKHTTDVDAVLNELRLESQPHVVNVAGMELTVLPGVLSPRLSHAPDSLMEFWEIPEGSSVLDLGCGCGILGLAALRSGASYLVALDINPQAVKNADINLKKLNLDDRGEARLSDGYAALKSDELFETIIFAAPYWDREATDDLEKSCFDQGHFFFERAVKKAHMWLTADGSMYIIFSDQGNVSKAIRIIDESELQIEEMHLVRPTQKGGHIRIVWELRHRG